MIKRLSAKKKHAVKLAWNNKDSEAFTRAELTEIKGYCMIQWEKYCLDGYMSYDDPRAIELEDIGLYAEKMIQYYIYRKGE